MKVDIGEVFTRSWQIIWKHRVLWLYGFVLMLASFLILPLAFVPMIAPAFFGSYGKRMMNNPIFILAVFTGFFLFIVALFPVSTLLNSALTLGALHGESGEEKLSFMDLIRESYPFFWRVLGTMLLFTGGMLLVIFAFSVLMMIHLRCYIRSGDVMYDSFVLPAISCNAGLVCLDGTIHSGGCGG